MPNPRPWLDFLTMDMRPDQRRAVYTFCWRVGLALHAAIACGWLAWAGLGGFAWASDVQRVSNDVSSIKVEIVEQRIFDTRLRQCRATGSEPRLFYRQKLQELLRKYRELTAAAYALPSCEEL